MAESVQLTKHRITVLLVDDQPMIGEAIRRMVASEEDIDFHYCQDPAQAIKSANNISPTVILQDLVMPEIGGLLLVRYFRANPATQQVPLIVLSSKEEPVVKAEAFTLGANDYMVKFPDKLEVLARIRYHSRGYITLLERNEAYGQLERANRFIRKTFGRYLSDDIVNTILESPNGLSLGGEKRVVTIMMTDLRGFTSIGERLAAESVVRMLNIYLESMTEIIFRYQGTIDEFIGDAILAIFGAPILRDDDAQRAVACAVDMQLAIQEVNAKNREAGYPDVEMGIGINTGELVVGNVGSSKRTKYGVVGRHVNLTSRIESYTVGGQILISESTLKACSGIVRVDGQEEVMPKGVIEPIVIYDVGGIGGEFDIFLPPKKPSDLFELQKPFPFEFVILDDKHAGRDVYHGDLLQLAETTRERTAVAETDKICRQLTNLKISLFDEHHREITKELYAKVIDVISLTPSTFRMNFTSVPPEAEKFFKRLRERHERS
ncbi:MAG: response regulator [bacterium]|nr:response regulator [bacterium]